MELFGLQKITLLDYPGLMACTVFTGGCDFRCPFCHNASLVLPEDRPLPLPEEEFFAFLQKRRGILDGVCITGGEPLMHEDTAELMRRIRGLGLRVKLDTNGSFPERLRRVMEEGLADMVAMDIKNSPAKYGETIGIPGWDIAPVRESAALLMSGTVPFEFRTTVVRPYHEAADFEAIGQWLAGDEAFFLQQFTDSGELLAGAGLSACSRAEMEHFADILRQYIPRTQLRGLEQERT